jgi:hypothetical protein
LAVMPVALVVSAGQPECHFYFARRVSFLSCADMIEARGGGADTTS